MVENDIERFFLIRQLLIEIDRERWFDNLVSNRFDAKELHSLENIRIKFSEYAIEESDANIIAECFEQHKTNIKQYVEIIEKCIEFNEMGRSAAEESKE